MGTVFVLAFFALSSFAQEFNPNEKSQCPTEENSAYRWDNRRNLCVLKREASQAREAFQKCQSLDGPDEQKACFEENRNRLVGDDATTVKDPLEGKLSTVTASVPMAFFVVGAVTKKAANSRPGCLSKRIFKYASVAGIGAEAYIKLVASRKFKNLQKEYEDLKETDPYSMQVAAFKFLEDQQKEVASLAGRQKNIYKTLAVSYVSAAGVATVESAMIAGLKPCGSIKRPDTENPSDNPQEEGGPGVSKLVNLLGHSPGIAIVSGVMTALYGTLERGAVRAEKKALENAKTVKEMRERFEQMYTSAGFCSSRKERGVPNCYCYTDEGKRDPLKTQSETCQKLWAFHERNLFVAANNKELSSSSENLGREGCVDRQQQFDADCKCLRVVDEKGENSCYKTLITSFQGLPSGIDAQESLKDLDQMTNGGLAGETFGEENSNKKAARADFRLKDILDKQESLHKQKGWPSIKKTLASIDNSFKKNPPNPKLFSGPLGFKGAANFSVPKNLQTNIGKTLKDNNNLAKALTLGKTSVAPSKKRSKSTSPFNESASNGPKTMDDFMKKNYDYSTAQDDITDAKEKSLWRIISYRYIQTGLERLFED